MRAFSSLVACAYILPSVEPNRKDGINTQMYLDIKPANTSKHLEAIRLLTLSTFRLSYERSDSNRKRVGIIGPELAAIIPDAVEIVPKRTLPPLEKGGAPVELENFPRVNEQTLFMYSVGATQELAQMLSSFQSQAKIQMGKVATMYGELNQLEQLLSSSSDGDAELKMREAAAKAAIAKYDMELEISLAQNEKEYSKMVRVSEQEQAMRSEVLTMERLKREDEAATQRTEKALKIKFETSQRIDQARSQSAESTAALEHQQKLLLQKAAEEMKVKTSKIIAIAKAEAERANEDIHIRRLQAESEQRRKRNIAAINAVFTHLSKALSTSLRNPKQVVTFICYICLLTSAIFVAKEMSRLIRSIIEATIGKPQLIRETTRQTIAWSLWTYVTELPCYLKLRRNKCAYAAIEESFDDLILPQDLKARVMDLAYSARNARRHNAPFRHVLLYGPPGTGKTMVAKKLANVIGIDYAMMSGGDVSPLGSDAVTQIHNLFSWAKMSPKGVILFVDEAECFLGSRDSGLMSDTAHNALNALLYNTGGDRKDFMLVLATNRAEYLDAAILDRCDDSIFFPLPDASCRKDLILLYFDTHLRKFIYKHNEEARSLRFRITKFFTKKKAFFISVESDIMTGKQLEYVVASTQGFSGREISKVMVALQGAMYISKDGKLDFVTAQKIIETKVREHMAKLRMTTEPLSILGGNVFQGDDACSIAADKHEISRKT